MHEEPPTMRSERRTQANLFEQVTLVPVLPPSLRAKLTPLLQELLKEAADQRSPAEADDVHGEEGCDEQDHA
jgi:hypothetical protein